jgi:hypothetical protein
MPYIGYYNIMQWHFKKSRHHEITILDLQICNEEHKTIKKPLNNIKHIFISQIKNNKKIK